MSKSVYIKAANPLWHRLDNGLLQLVTWAARLGGLMLLMVGLFVLYEVVCRYVFQSPTLWVMDCSIYFVMWAVLLGSAYTMRTRGHVLVDVLTRETSQKKWGVGLTVKILKILSSPDHHRCRCSLRCSSLPDEGVDHVGPLHSTILPDEFHSGRFRSHGAGRTGTLFNLILFNNSDIRRKEKAHS